MLMSTPLKLIKPPQRQLHKFFHILQNLHVNHLPPKDIMNVTNKNILTTPIKTATDSKLFCFDDYDIVGFDLDNTLMRYNLREMIPLEYQNITNFLVKQRGYSRELLRPVSDDIDFMQKGLIFDVDRGNILKIAPDGYILKAAHGSKFLSENQIIHEYGPERCWDVTTKFVNDPLSTWNGPLSERMRTLLDYFDMPASLAFARAVDAIDIKNKSRSKKYTVYSDILDAMIEMFNRQNFAECNSEYFEALKAKPNQYIMRTEPKVIQWLRELKKSKATFLLTGSNIDFANLTASTSLGSDWQQLFDVVVCFARKPAFFIERRPFYQVENLKETTQMSSSKLELGSTYSQGNWTDLKLLLSSKFKASNPRSLYIGDNLIQDIHTPFKHANIDTICVAEEIAAEEEVNSYEFSKILNSNSWGSYFFIDDKITLWTGVIKRHAKMCVPSVDYLSEKPLDFQYCTKPLGFYPMLPSLLKV